MTPHFLHHLAGFRRARYYASVALSLGAVLSGCDQVSYVRILDARLSRDANDLVVAEIEVEAAEKGGGNVGPYCVSIHYLPVGTVLAEGHINYPGEVDWVEQCGVDLSDGDQRFFNLTSNLVLDPSLPARVQVRQHGDFQIFEGVFTPAK